MSAPDSDHDLRPWRVFTRDQNTGLLIHDGLIYRGRRCAEREARKIRRMFGQVAEAQPAT